MRRIFITGSADGLGLVAGRMLVEQGHGVVLHARNETRAAYAKENLPGCDAVVVGDVSTLAAMKSVAAQANALGRFDSVIHNVALGVTENRVLTADGLTEIFAVNVVAPYVLTALITPPERLVYLSSDMHERGNVTLDDPQWERRPWHKSQAYAETKFHDLTLCMFVARRWPHVLANALNPGWVPTRMGGRNAPGNLRDGATTQVWLAASDEPAAMVTGCYFHHQEQHPFKRTATRPEVQQRLVDYLERVTGIAIDLDPPHSLRPG